MLFRQFNSFEETYILQYFCKPVSQVVIWDLIVRLLLAQIVVLVVIAASPFVLGDEHIIVVTTPG